MDEESDTTHNGMMSVYLFMTLIFFAPIKNTQMHTQLVESNYSNIISLLIVFNSIEWDATT